jgi:hypothetical protein
MLPPGRRNLVPQRLPHRANPAPLASSEPHPRPPGTDGWPLGVKRLYPHLLRHTFANLYLCSEGDLRSLQLILGHADMRTTAMIYTAPDTRDLQAKQRLHSPLSQIARDLAVRRPAHPEGLGQVPQALVSLHFPCFVTVVTRAAPGAGIS